MHQQRCLVIEKKDENHRLDFKILNNDVSGISTKEWEIDINKLVSMELKLGMKLPRLQVELTAGNEFFNAVFVNIQLNEKSIDSTIKFINNIIYDYFTNLFVTINSTNHTNDSCGKDKNLTNKLRKKKLKQLKMNDNPCQEIKYVPHMLHSKLKNQHIVHSSATTVN